MRNVLSQSSNNLQSSDGTKVGEVVKITSGDVFGEVAAQKTTEADENEGVGIKEEEDEALDSGVEKSDTLSAGTRD